MPDEEVLYHNDESKVTVTRRRLILGYEVTEIASIKSASYSGGGFFDKDSGCFLFFGITVGLILIGKAADIHIGIVLGAFVLLCILTAVASFFPERPYVVHITMKEGQILIGTMDGRTLTKLTVKEICDAINLALKKHWEEHDPRIGLSFKS